MAATESEREVETSTENVVDAIVEASALQQFIETLTPIVDEARLHFNEEGLQASVVDPANVAMAEPHLSTEAFESYASGRITIGLNLIRLDDRLSVANAGDLVHLVVDMETRMLDIEINNIEQSLAMIDPGSIRVEPDTPDGLVDGMTTKVVIEGADLDEAVTVADMVSDHIWLRSDLDDRVFSIGGEGDIDESWARYSNDELIDADVDDDGKTLLSVDYVKDLNKPIPKDAEVTIRHGTEWPVILEYESAEGTLEVKNRIAPRIKSE